MYPQTLISLFPCGLESLDSGAGERSPEPNWMVWQAELRKVKHQGNSLILGLLSALRGFLTSRGGVNKAVEGCHWVVSRLYMIKRQRRMDMRVHRRIRGAHDAAAQWLRPQ